MEKQYTISKYPLNSEFIKSIIIPKFQRGLVWKPSKEKDFIRNVLLGYPFGSILIYKTKNEEKFRLIDGLQRMNLLNKYLKDKFEYLDYEYIDDEMCRELLNYHYKKNNRNDEIGNDTYEEMLIELKKTIFNSIKNHTNVQHDVFDSDSFMLVKSERLNEMLKKIVKRFKDVTNINDLTIPTIIYKGDYSNVPDIFYNLNVGGVKLSKYETFSSLWGDEKIVIDDDEILNIVKQRYKQLETESDFEVDDMDEDIDKGITLFEYCYALSEIIKNNYSILFVGNKKSTDPAGFEMLTMMCGLQLGNECDVYKVLKNANSKFLCDLKEIIKKTLNTIVEILKEWIVAKNGKNNITNRTYMIYHMAMSYIKNNYDINCQSFTVKIKKSTTFNQCFERYLPDYYIFDNISNFWSENRQVSSLKREIDYDYNRYSCKISKKKWEKVLEQFKEDQKKYLGQSISFESKLFLDYLVKMKIKNEKYSKDRDRDESYFKVDIDFETKKPISKVDFEHIATIEIILSKYKKYSDIKTIIKERKLPVYSLGNMCYLTTHINRSKQGKTIPYYEYAYPGIYCDTKYKALINYPLDDEILEFINLPAEEFEEEYKEFISTRINKLIEDFKKYVIN